MYEIEHFLNQVIQGDCLDVIKEIPDNSIDAIITDPPYVYLKNVNWDNHFDEDLLFTHFKRILKDKGFVVIFGRGESFYQRNVKLIELGFKFKEEIIWDKNQNTSPFNKIARVHETISIFTKNNGVINKVKVSYEEEFNDKTIVQDYKRIMSGWRGKDKNAILDYLNNGFVKKFDRKRVSKHNITMSNAVLDINRAVNAMNKVINGFVEKSIITINREHYKMNHPTQKPVRLMERLLNLVTNENDIVLDPFAGSGSTLIACKNLNRRFIGIELEQDYCEIAKKRIEAVNNLFTK